jgi:CDP-glucose 4,6-dehydratase
MGKRSGNSMNNIFKGKTVLVTGHTGFKGSWLSIWLKELGANVIGYALEPYTPNDNFVVSKLESKITSVIGDVRDYDKLKGVFDKYKPQIVFHLAAQPIVRLSYKFPKPTYDINIGGTVNVLECCRITDSVRVIINVTSDKCYQNNEWLWGYRENDALGGVDPYSSSKACSELITSAYKESFYKDKFISTVRAGNVIGGGDWQQDRIVPDCIRSLKHGENILVRNPHSIRHWQHVLDVLNGYLTLASKMWDGEITGAWNFSSLNSAITVEDLVQRIIKEWGSGNYIDLSNGAPQPHETKVLKLDISKVINLLGWKPKLSIDDTIKYTVNWYKTVADYEYCVGQIRDYESRLV